MQLQHNATVRRKGPFQPVMCVEAEQRVFLLTHITLVQRGSPWVLVVKNPPANAGDTRHVGSIPGSGRSLGVGNGTPLQVLAWKIPWAEEPGRLQSTGLQSWGRLSTLSTQQKDKGTSEKSFPSCFCNFCSQLLFSLAYQENVMNCFSKCCKIIQSCSKYMNGSTMVIQPNILLTVESHQIEKKDRPIKVLRKMRFPHLATRFMITHSNFSSRLAVSSYRKGSGGWAELQMGKIFLSDFGKKMESN